MEIETQKAEPVVRAYGEVRGTQSFVGVMARVWRQPSLTGLELLWRWGAGVPILALCLWEFLRLHGALHVDAAALSAMTVFRPVKAVATIAAQMRRLQPVLPVAAWVLPLAFVLRTLAAALGRAALLRRLDTTLRPRRSMLGALYALRALALLAVLAIWGAGVWWANEVTILGPAARGEDPNVVLLCALIVFEALALFVLWASAVWVLDAASVFAAERRSGVVRSLRSAVRSGALRSKLMEINLVMGIVKVGLLVLLLVLSACPLPFETVESQRFLAWWWAFSIVMYLAASDYFHAVRSAACLTLYRAYQVTVD